MIIEIFKVKVEGLEDIYKCFGTHFVRIIVRANWQM